MLPREDYTSNAPLAKRQYVAKIQIDIPNGIADELPAKTHLCQILVFDLGRKKPATASNGEEIQHDPSPDLAERKSDYISLHVKKQRSKCQTPIKAQAARRSHKRIQRRRAAKRHQVRTILHYEQPQAVALESLRLPNMLA